MHILRAPDFLVAMSTLLTHAEGSSTLANTPRSSKRSSSTLNFSLRADGIHHEFVMEGLALSCGLC